MLNTDAFRLAMQYIISGESTGYSGQLLSGSLKVNDPICFHPGKHLGKITRIVNGYSEVEAADAGQK